MSNWFGSFGFPMSGFAGYLTAPLELQIFSINLLGLISSAWNWRLFKWNQQLEKIWKLSVSQPDEVDVKNIDWIKSILSRIVVARLVINHILLLTYIANIYTVLTQSGQNVLILWMVLSSIKDIVLEIVVIFTTFILWYEGSVSSSLLIEFIAEKTIWLIVSVCKLCTTFKWYMHLRKVEKIRKFSITARKSIPNIVYAPEKIRHSLDDECLDIATIRRGKYESLLNLDELSKDSPNKVNFNSLPRTSKSMTTLTVINDSCDSNDTNDYNSNANELSVAEKSMKMLNITAEDVMDACSRIHERSYWSEQENIVETSEPIEETCTSLEKDEEQTDTQRKGQDVIDVEKVIDDSLRQKEEIMRNPPIEKKKEVDTKTSLTDSTKEEIVTGKEEQFVDFSLTKDEDMTSDKVKQHVKCDCVMCVSFKEIALKNGKNMRLINIDDNREHDVDEEEFQHFTLGAITQKDKSSVYGPELECSEYHLRKQTSQESQRSSRKLPITWDTMSLAQIAHPSGYEKRFPATNELSICQKCVQTDNFNDSRDFLNLQNRLKHILEMQYRRSADLRSIYNPTSLEQNDYTKLTKEREAIELRALRIYNDLTLLEDKKQIKARERCDLLSSHTQLKPEETELRASKAHDEFTLSESEKEMEARKKRMLSLNDKQLIEESKTKELESLSACNNLTSKDIINLNARKSLHSSLNCRKSNAEVSNVTAHNKFILEDERDMKTTEHFPLNRKYVYCNIAILKREEDANSPTSFPNHPTRIDDGENTTEADSSEARSNENNNDDLNVRHLNTLLNLRENTKNIESAVQSCEVTNKSFQSLENGRYLEYIQRDIVDDSNINILHADVVFKQQIMAKVFYPVQTKIAEPPSNSQISWQENFNTSRSESDIGNFIRRKDNEMDVLNQESLFLSDYLGNSNLANANNNQLAQAQTNHDLSIAYIKQKRIPNETETTIVEEQADIEPHENAHFVDDVNVRPSINSLKNDYPYNLQKEQYLSMIDNNFEKKIYVTDISLKISDNNTTLRSSDSDDGESYMQHKTKKYVTDFIFESTSKISLFSRSPSIKSDCCNVSVLKQDHEKFPKLIQFSDSEDMLENREAKTQLDSSMESDNEISQLPNKNTTFKNKFKRMRAQNEVESKDQDKTNKPSTEKLFRINSSEKLQQDDSFDSIYEKNDSSIETPVSLEEGSLMEEFSSYTPRTSSDISVKNFAHF